MRYSLPLILVCIGLSFSAFGQRFGYVDSQYILENMPAYKAVQEEIEQQSDRWEKEIEVKQDAIEKKFEEYQAKRVLMNEQQKQKMQQEIQEMEQELAQYRSEKFGYDGELFTMREEKMKPIQERMLNAVESVSKNKRADFIFDKSSTAVVLYSNPQFDYTDEVLEALGISAPAPQGGGGGGQR